MLNIEDWAQEHFGAAELGDKRRSRRLVAVAVALARQPGGLLPRALPDWGDLRAAYRLWDSEEVTFARVLQPHWQRTRQACAHRPPGSELLLIEDTTTLDYTAHPHTRGLGRIGDDGGRGLLLHTTLAVGVAAADLEEEARGAEAGAPPPATLIGLAAQSLWARPLECCRGEGVRAGYEPKARRLSRERESQRSRGRARELPRARRRHAHGLPRGPGKRHLRGLWPLPGAGL